MFTADGDIDETLTAAHWRWLIDQGVDGLVIAGTSGEFIAMENDERRRLFALAHDVSAGRVPIVAGTGHYSTRFTIELSLDAQRHGADAVIVILPYYQRPSKAAVLRHFREVRAAIDVPLMLYNNPVNSACVDFSPVDVAALVDDDVVHLVKATYASVEPVHDLRLLCGDRLGIFYGSFIAGYEALAGGAHGWISGLLNIVPVAALALHDAAVVRRDMPDAWRIWTRLLPLVHLYTHQQIGPVSDLAIYRAILDEWGRAGGHSRAPFYPLDAGQRDRLRSCLARCGWTDPAAGLEAVTA